jgi:uncharacterized OsmC-like protein
MNHVDVTWKGGTSVLCSDTRGYEMMCDWDNDLSPVQIMVQMAGACSLADVITGMKDREYESLSVGIDYERNNEEPRYVTKMNLIFKISTDIKWAKFVRRVIDLSMKKHCSVSNTLSGVTEITWELVIN